MRSRSLSASIVTGVLVASGAGIPAAQASAPVVHHPVVSTYAAHALTALEARWNAEAAAYKASRARLAAARALGAVDARWNAEAAAYKARLAAARALAALDARWNAEASYFGSR